MDLGCRVDTCHGLLPSATPSVPERLETLANLSLDRIRDLCKSAFRPGIQNFESRVEEHGDWSRAPEVGVLRQIDRLMDQSETRKEDQSRMARSWERTTRRITGMPQSQCFPEWETVLDFYLTSNEDVPRAAGGGII